MRARFGISRGYVSCNVCCNTERKLCFPTVDHTSESNFVRGTQIVTDDLQGLFGFKTRRCSVVGIQEPRDPFLLVLESAR